MLLLFLTADGRRWTRMGTSESASICVDLRLEDSFISSGRGDGSTALAVDPIAWFTLLFPECRLRHTDGSNLKLMLGKEYLSVTLSAVFHSNHDC